MKSLTIAQCTCRTEPHLDWLIDSLLPQINAGETVEVLQIKHGASPEIARFAAPSGATVNVRIEPPKPTVWSGPFRLCKDEWWSKSNDLNSAICLARGEWFATCDDRSVLMPGWLDAVRRAMEGEYAVCGSYSKRHNVIVQNGIIIDRGSHDGTDPRSSGGDHRRTMGIVKAPGQWWFGCTNALPLEWALQVNGYSELYDSLRAEDCNFGMMLQNNNYPIRYEIGMEVLQDRTPGQCGPVLKSTCKEKHPNDVHDKGHAALKRYSRARASQHHWNIREIRAQVQAGMPFPHHNGQPATDWFDGQPIAEFV